MDTRKIGRAKEFILGKSLGAAFVVVLAALIGYQVYDPSKRVVEAIVGLLFTYLIARFPLSWSLAFFIIIFPFPFALKVGTSNVVFLPLMIIIWLIRVSLGNVPPPRGSILDRIIIFMTISYIVSFYNNPGGNLLVNALLYVWVYFTAIGFFYLIVNFIQDEKSLMQVVNAGVIGSFLVMVFCVLEMVMPGSVIVPGWLYTGHKQALVMKNIRIGGPFKDYELLAEYFALNIPILILLYVRAKRLLLRYAYFGLIILCFGLLMATSTRGAFISLFAGMAYMLFVIRRDLNIVRVTAALAVAAVLLLTEETLVAKYTISGGMFNRLFKTKFVGFIPDTRAHAWPKALERAKQHIIIGHSPEWDLSRKLEKFNWPHNGYLFYLNITGLFGLITFLLLLYTLLRSSIKLKATSMYDESFPRALMLVLHVMMVIFMVDELKIDYLRNYLYIYFIWFFFGLIAATHNVIVDQQRREAMQA
jgi:O-antigen ligase